MEPQPSQPLEVFFSYAHEDEELKNKLDNHLALLRHQDLIKQWNDRMMEGGVDWANEIDEHINSAQVILLLISDAFMASKYCYGVEMKRALERHENEEARVIPIILSPVDWESSPISKLQALPKDGKPIKKWRVRDDAFKDIAQGIRKVIENFKPKKPTAPRQVYIPRPPVIGFVTRKDEEEENPDILERLKEGLAPGSNQLLTLYGAGGVGKTTIAAQAARTLEEAYQSRIVWSDVNARAGFTLSTLLDDIAIQLGQPDLRQLKPEDKEARVSALVADPPALVVLDNYETIPQEEQPRIVAWLAGTKASALITSRPKIEGTLNVKIPKMSIDEAEDFLKRIIRQTQEPQIFSDAIRQRIYWTARANPFVMEWIVAQIDQAREPDSVLEELTHGEGNAAQRVFDRSFNLPQLGDDGRAALLALSLFAPSATREALAAVAGFGDDRKRIDEAVRNLHALWLIKGIDENRRFTIEGLTRSLAEARLSRDDRAAEFTKRFIQYFLDYTREHEAETPENYDLLEAEKDNLLKAMDTSFDSGDLETVRTMAGILANPVHGMLGVRGHWDEAFQQNEQALKAARTAQANNGISSFAHNLAVIYQSRGDLTKARQLYNESLEIAKKLDYQPSIAITVHQLGLLAQDEEDLEEARRLYNESLEIKKKLGNQRGIAATLHNLAVIAQDEGDLEEARRLYDESLEIHKKLGNQADIATSLHQLGRLAQDEGDLEEARRLYNESLEIKKKLGNQAGIATSLHQLGRLAEAQGDLEEGRRLYDESLEIDKKLGNQDGIAISLSNLGRLAQEQGDLSEAKRLWREALGIYERLGSPHAEGVRRRLERIEGEA